MAALATLNRVNPSAGKIAVAYSGGRDSTALLHATAVQAVQAGLQVLALHIHHGLSVHADEWLAHCEAQCAALAASGFPVSLEFRRLSGAPRAAESVEAWARAGRHAALHEMCAAAGIDLLLLAQHRRDQAETLLLQALRGAGVAGLAGMPAQQWREGVCWARPWLTQTREAIEAYVALHRLKFVEDDSNSDPRFARNRLRMQVWPALNGAFGHAEAGLALAAGWAQQALALQQEMAAADLAVLSNETGLDMPALRELSIARASNALRAWVHAQGGQAAPASLIERLLTEPGSSWPCASGSLHLYRGRLQWRAASLAPIGPSQSVNLGSPGLYPQPAWGGQWQVEMTHGLGVSARLLTSLQQRQRSGGEQFQRGARTVPRSLKKAWQEAGVPAWEREGPLLFHGEQLVFVPGLGLDARVLASSGESRLSLTWTRNP